MTRREEVLNSLMERISTGPLPPDRAAATRRLLLRMQAENPWIVAYALSGSYGSPGDVFPDADVDINFLGVPGQHPTALRSSQEFRLDGVDFHFSNRFFGAQVDPEHLSLAALIVVYRWHVLWECDAAISSAQHTLARLLTQPAWRAERLSAELARTRRELAEWCKRTSWTEMQAWELDFFWQCVFKFTSLLSPIDLRAVSLARKGLLEIVDVLRRAGLPEAEEMALHCVGAHDFAPVEAEAWLARAEGRCAQVCLGDAPDRRHDHLYYLSGARELIRRGEPRAAAFPLWRTFRTCRQLLGETPSGKDTAGDIAQLAGRLGQATDAQLAEKAGQCRRFCEHLEAQSERLLEHMGQRVENERSQP